MNNRHNRNIELLAPAKDIVAATAAIDYGADAVYIGASKFGARYAAGNTIDDIARVVEYARRYSVRVYSTLNTILYEDELEEARQMAQRLIDAGIDALIFQDMAYLEMGLSGVEFHASTQVYNADPRRVRFLQECGVSRVILERGLTLQQIRAVSADSDIELEAFVHGAICVCNSGRCYMSRSMGPRSGNRGECSQPCRLTYDLLDGNMNPVMSGKHLMSVKDLDLSERIGEMIDAGISSFKIEGRLKDASYVKNTVNYYRRKIDDELQKRPYMKCSSAGRTVTDITPDLSKSFTRGRSQYFFDGVRRGVASFDTPKALGEDIGKVIGSGRGWIELDRHADISTQDGLCFMSCGELVGTKVNKTEGLRLFLDKDFVVGKGERVYRNFNYLFEKALTGGRTKREIDVEARVVISADRVELTYRDEQGFVSIRSAAGLFEEALNEEKMLSNVRVQVSKSGDTIFRITEIDIESFDGIRFVPVSLLSSLRREALDDLLSARLQAPARRNISEISDPAYPYVSDSVSAEENVTNSLARAFYERHGVKNIADGLDMKPNMRGERVMRTPYCIRREIGECLLEKPRLVGELYLRRGSYTYALEFDCKECQMSIRYI